MATVTGITAARAAAIEAASIVGGTVTGGNLILTRFNGTTINAGSVIGPTGATGNTGAAGAAGTTGATGAQGPAGAAGSVWISGTGAPLSGTGSVGYWYLNDANGDVYEKTGASTWTLRDNLTGPAGSGGSSALETNFPVTLGVALSDETSAITTGVKGKIRSPFAFTLNEVRINVGTAETSAIMTVNILNGAGTTIFTTKVTIDANEKTSLSAAIPAVLLITAIAADEELTFSVDVTGTVGRGLKCWLIGTRVVTVTSAPSAIITIAVQPANTSAILTWTAPANGGSAITDYIVEYKLNSSGTWLTFTDGVVGTTGASVTGLTNASLYDFRVSAVNAIGTSIPSPIVSATPATEPGAPTSLSGTPGSTSVALTWTAPASNGGSALTDYKIEYKLNSSGTWTEIFDGVSTSTSYTISGLGSSTNYDVRVSARNAVGFGAVSSIYNFSTSVGVTVPGAPTGLTGTPAGTSNALTWTAPASNGGSALTDYIVQYKLTSEPTTWTTFSDGTSTTTSATVTGLTISTSYDFQVLAVNAIGNSAPSTTYTASTTGASAPGAPTSLSGTPGSTSVALTWTAPASNGGSALTDYIVQYKLTSEPTTWTTFSDGTSTTTSATVTGLTTGGTSYDFRVAAVNAIGTGTVTSTYTASTTGGATVPGAPTGLTLTPSSTSIGLSWTAPASNGGSALTDYVVDYRQYNDNGSYTTFSDGTSTTTSTTITGLSPGTEYEIRIRAVNAIGPGNYHTPVRAVCTSGSGMTAGTHTRLNTPNVGLIAYDSSPAETLSNASNIVGGTTVTLNSSTRVSFYPVSIFEESDGYACSQTFLEFDTLLLSGTISSAVLEVQFYGVAVADDFIVEAYVRDYGPSLSGSDMLPRSTLTGLTLAASFDTSGVLSTSTYIYHTFTNSGTALKDGINTAGKTRLLLASSKQRLNAGGTVDVGGLLTGQGGMARLTIVVA